MANLRFLVISLGNQAPYYDTLHSAGHHALNALQLLLGPSQPPFTLTRIGKKASLASIGPKYILVQSPTYMNTSGPWASATWKEIIQDYAPADLALALVHDELELAPGVVKRRAWERSHRGHNGVKSVNSKLKRAEYPDSAWERIGVGIGRPEERDAKAVSQYVLGPMSRFQKEVVAGKGGEGVLRCLQEVEAEWRAKVGGA
ncbi:related to aminoacyl-tRNA hydrolase [Cephalotrichum gorgonifer]|uniref:peptidyl-tRNA hydrolase n=1 Tax=Cephalotrichum gorgonifer TaxID=2041049 RepID=A0AAE8MTP6_9PEZI|nr:related to aminoacyl-tRNA hydrolase [Cephalotrichum gorgonifer]